jgi:hypothetical protein
LRERAMPVTRLQKHAPVGQRPHVARRPVHGALACLLSGAVPLSAAAQGAPPAADSGSSVEQRLQRLEQRQQELERQLQQKDAEIQQLKRQQAGTQGGAGPSPGPALPQEGSKKATVAGPTDGAAVAAPVAVAAAAQGPPQAEMPESGGAPAPPQKWGTYTENFGFKTASTDRGELSTSIYTYARYLNQLATKADYTFAATGTTSTIQRRQEIQLLKVQIKFLGWILDPKFTYFLYAWSSNATQGQGAQVVLAGNLNYAFNNHVTLSGGVTSLPGVRSTEGNFPFWLNVDNRLMADEFMRPSYTSGVWAKGEIVPGLRYQAMLGNNLSTLGVSSAQLDNKLDTLATSLVWMPTTHEFGRGFGDFEDHQQLATRLGLHYTHSTETKQSQPGEDTIENTQIRLADGTIIFTPNLFGPGITVDRVGYQMGNMDAGIKYRGMALEGEYYWRKLDRFEGPGTAGLGTINNQGFQLQASMMAIQKRLQLYVGGSRIDGGQYGHPWDVRFGTNFFPWKNRVFRWNTQVMYLEKSPVGYTSLTYNVGSTGWIFNTDFEMAL